jgi:hypothetical protein
MALILFGRHAYRRLFKWEEIQMNLSLALSLEYLLLLLLISCCQMLQLESFFQRLIMVTELADFHLSISFNLEVLLIEFCSGTALQPRISQLILK